MADALFKKYKKQIIKEMGKKALADDQINKIGKELFGTKWKGVFPQDRLKTTPGYYIINTDKSTHINSNSSHWVAIKMDKSTMFVYDSFGRTTRYVLPLIYAKTKKKLLNRSMTLSNTGLIPNYAGN